jgi:two-component system chemotaxis sensor kinase CheA
MDDLLPDFLTETNESLAELDVALVRLEQVPDDAETLAAIFRLVHTIKGTCGFLGLPRLERVAHAAENVLGRVRDGALSVTPGLVTAILAALDRVKEILAGLAAYGQEPSGDDAALIAALEAVGAGQTRMEPPASAPGPVASGEAASGAQTIRVGVDVLENLMTLVSELVLTRNQLLQLARTEENSPFAMPLQRLSHITSDLQEGVMKTRMQPIGNAWSKLPRLVRDLGHELGKKIELVMRGAETELDRQVLELIRDPLTHMVRNSADHGLESPEERRVTGKPETGLITLNAFHEGGQITIEIADDGRGLAIERIRAKVLTQGLASEAELAAMSDSEIQRFIFRPGFSTASVLTAVSGRGVGMDVVKTNIERIGGAIELRSSAGVGTTFTIRIPLTIAIISALIVESSGERFAIPQIGVVELIRARAATGATGSDETSVSQIEQIDGTSMLRLRDRLVPLVRLGEVLKLGPAAIESREDRDGSVYVVVAQAGANTLGIIVDRVFDTEEIVVKPVAPILRHLTVFGGNTILGDGSVIMILDPSGIARATGASGNTADRANEAHSASAVTNEKKTAMLIFRAGDTGLKAVPLELVTRLENIPRESVETCAGELVTQYRGHLIPLIPLSGTIDPEAAHLPVLVLAGSDDDQDRDRCLGLIVDEIIDVVEDHIRIELSANEPGLLGSAVIAGRATEVIDTGKWLRKARSGWFRRADVPEPARIAA